MCLAPGGLQSAATVFSALEEPMPSPLRDVKYTCPCCGYRNLEAPAYDELTEPVLIREIQVPYRCRLGRSSGEKCKCCGFVFGKDDEPEPGEPGISFEEHLEKFQSMGCPWACPDEMPSGWTLARQLADIPIQIWQRNYMCPCCGYPGLDCPPYEDFSASTLVRGLKPPYYHYFGWPSYDVCECCGFEFGNDDDPGPFRGDSFDEYFERWVADGCNWFQPKNRPPQWTIEQQLAGVPINDWLA